MSIADEINAEILLGACDAEPASKPDRIPFDRFAEACLPTEECENPPQRCLLAARP